MSWCWTIIESVDPFSRAPWPQVTAMYPRIICQVGLRMRSLPLRYRIINFMRPEITLFLTSTIIVTSFLFGN